MTFLQVWIVDIIKILQALVVLKIDVFLNLAWYSAVLGVAATRRAG
jgi:hypothetical protein